jgi:BspA type Leucine rich repeat region (6 copies)
VAASNPDYSSANGVLFNKAQTTLIAFPGGGGGSYTVPNSVTSIEEGAFESCSGLTNVDTGNGVTNIGTNAFEFCTGLTSVTIGSSVTSIGYEAFYYCYSLTSVTIPSSVASIGDYAFYDCANLTNLTFLGNAPTLGGPSVFDSVSAAATVYYYAGKSGWELTYGGLTTMELSAPPQLGSGVGIHTGNFGFTIIGVNNQVITVEASTNLVNWQVIQTITLFGTSTNVTDTQWKSYPRRFYRAY